MSSNKRSPSDQTLDTANSKKLKGSSGSSNPPSLPFIPSDFIASRAKLLTNGDFNKSLNINGQCVIYWMSRDQRAEDNHAIHYAQSVALSLQKPLIVVFNLVPKFLQATLRQYGFMITGLKEVEACLRSKGIPFHLMMGDPTQNIPAFVKEQNAVILVSDFSPLRVGKGWVHSVAATLDSFSASDSSSSSSSGGSSVSIPMVQVDAHNIVPCWVASNKLEYSARTIRSKIQSLLPTYLPHLPPPLAHNPRASPSLLDVFPLVDWDAALASLEIDRSVPEVQWISPGAAAAMATLTTFAEERLANYGEQRNDPNKQVASNLSPYFHFGQLSAQRAVVFLKSLKKNASSVDVFVEECVVRRELSENFCHYNPLYDSLDGCNDWAKETLRIHSADPRPIQYTLAQFEEARTHDDLWNAAQIQLTQEGKMHGFLRMYWAKKILEWSSSPQEALATAIFLNDKYELDGRDPNGYVGCMWSIGGIHDQGWGERSIFGKIRYMNYQGCERKFSVKSFVSKYPPAAANAATVAGNRTLSFQPLKKTSKPIN
eukprot:gene22679-30961_t